METLLRAVTGVRFCLSAKLWPADSTKSFASVFATPLKLCLMAAALVAAGPARAPAQDVQPLNPAPQTQPLAPLPNTQQVAPLQPLAPLPDAQTLSPAQVTQAPPAVTPISQVAPAQAFKPEELDQLVAPVALYPDALLAQVCMASTYPLEIVMAARWQMQNQNLMGDQLNTALDMQPWDPSVKALVQVPPVLQMMSDKIDWTEKLGDAFLGQQPEVMAAVQRLRQLAQANGQLMTTSDQTVTTMGQTIIIEQPNPEVVYVPAYDPFYAYGAWPYPAYPPYYWPGYGFGLGFVLGAAIANGNWATHWNWNGGDLNINTNRNINGDRWQHNVDHRRGVNYRDQATRDRFNRGDAGAAGRRDFRGFDQGGGQLGQGLSNRASFGQGGNLSGFDGIGNGAQTRAQADRGRASTQSMNQSRSRANAQARSGAARAGGGGFRGGGGGGFRGGGGGGRR